MEPEVPGIRERESTVARECFIKCTPSPGGFSREGIVCAEESNERMICLLNSFTTPTKLKLPKSVAQVLLDVFLI